jgi:hypothetical protein
VVVTALPVPLASTAPSCMPAQAAGREGPWNGDQQAETAPVKSAKVPPVLTVVPWISVREPQPFELHARWPRQPGGT